MNEPTKRCSRCREFKALTEFHRDGGRTDGLNHRCKACNTIHQRNRYQKKRSLDPKGFRERGRAYELKHHYGITPQQYETLLIQQEYGCAICKQKPKGYLFVDHDHKTGVVRGLLCGLCNSATGLLKDSPELLRRAATYVESNNAGRAIASNAKGRLRLDQVGRIPNRQPSKRLLRLSASSQQIDSTVK